MNTADLPLIELGPPIIGEPEKQALAEVIDKGWITMGEKVKTFEKSFATLHGAPDAVAVHSATAALQLSLAAFDIGPGDEVLVPSLTFVATANVVVHAGATPVFVDIISAENPHIGLLEARAHINPRTRAIMLMHYGGYWMDVQAWRSLADEHGLLLFEDAAHAAGITKPVGKISDAASFSFFSNKNMTTAEGGMMLIRDPDRRERARTMRAHGMTASTLDRDRGRAVGYDVIECGHNFRLDELRAALGLVQIDRLHAWNKTRCELTLAYRQLVAELVPGAAIPFGDEHPTTAHILPLLLPVGSHRAAVMASMRAVAVQTSMHYPPIHEFSFYQNRFGSASLPHTEQFAAREMTLPLHPSLTYADVERVVRSLRDALSSAE
ncbi:MAG: DegT/DnrJ/EryC1/StrS aminotransferase family protein [Actinomycetia bacterium]|nr:DegT/DnrJ/EryC1/StrS aminotransferase family protein [Actinomycetes bacterium]